MKDTYTSKKGKKGKSTKKSTKGKAMPWAKEDKMKSKKK
jgi:hypothetical protein